MVCSYYDVLSKTARTEKHQQKMEVRKTKGEVVCLSFDP